MSLPATSIFAQLLELVPAATFDRLVHKHRHEAGAKGFASWQQFVAMLFMQLGQAHSLREIELGLGSMPGKLGHLRVSAPPARSTLAYANEHRPWQLYEELFQHILQAARQRVTQHHGHALRFKKRLFSIDATTIDLCAATFDWAKFRRTKGAVKLHLTLDHQGYLPAYAVITDGRQHEATVARTLEFPRGSVVAMDRGYIDYTLFAQWTERGIDFVTREKSSAAYEVVEERPVPAGGTIRADQIIRPTGHLSRQKCPVPLRRVVVWLADKEQELVLWTNNLTWAASTLARIYKERWQIELFFKALKQNFQVKTFVGTSANALKTQLWIAMIAIVLVQIVRMQAVQRWSVSNLVAFLRLHLFTYATLMQLIDDPTPTPRQTPENPTLPLTLAYG